MSDLDEALEIAMRWKDEKSSWGPNKTLGILSRALLSARTEERRIREDEARECLRIARNEAGSWLSPTAEDICIQIERRINEHADQTPLSTLAALTQEKK